MKRDVETAIKNWAANESENPLLLRGARRTGKTYTIEKMGREVAGDGFVKLDFQTNLPVVSELFNGPTDDIEGIISRIADYKRTSLSKDSSLIMFDEVQLCEKALNSLRFFAGSGWRIVATGSQLGVTTGHRKLPFPSGVRQLSMHPMTFEEFLWALGEAQMAVAIRSHAESLEPYAAHEEALGLFRLYQVVGGMPASVASYVEARSIDEARIQLREIDETYTADMTDPDNGISGVAARKLWRSIPSQLLRSSTKKFKYAEVERGGRRSKLIEPIEWLDSAGMVRINDLTESTEAPLAACGEDEGSFFKVYMADTGLMFYKFGINPLLWLEAESSASFPVSSDFKGALAENSVMQALSSNDLQTYYWATPSSWQGSGELDFLLQDDRMRVIPVEVKSGRNVKARTLKTFMEKARSPYAVLLSENNFSLSGKDGIEVRHLPLYAAHCLGENCLKVG